MGPGRTSQAWYFHSPALIIGSWFLHLIQVVSNGKKTGNQYPPLPQYLEMGGGHTGEVTCIYITGAL